MNRFLIAACLLIGLNVCPARAVRSEELYIAGWNCENLFDTEDDPKVEGDEEYTPDSAKHWTKERLNIKLDNLSSIIRKMNAGTARMSSASAKLKTAKLSRCWWTN